MTIRDIQTAVGPELWPDVDEAFNDIRRDCATQLQEKEKANGELTTQLTTANTAADEAKDALLKAQQTYGSMLAEAEYLISSDNYEGLTALVNEAKQITAHAVEQKRLALIEQKRAELAALEGTNP